MTRRIVIPHPQPTAFAPVRAERRGGYMPICPKCGKSEYVRISGKKGNRALCENCELFFDAEPGQPGKAKRLRLFLSYPHITEGSFDICGEIAAFLKSRGHEVWFDRDQLTGNHGADWRRSISEGIRNSQMVLACLNRHAVRITDGRRGVCLDELSIAISVKGGNINTVLLEPESLVKPNAALSHRQWLDMSMWRRMHARGEAVFAPWFREKMTELAAMVEQEDNYAFDGEITQIARLLTMTDYRLDKRSLLEKPFVGRKWLAREVDAWLLDPNGGHLCAIYGDPGIGKSAFAVQYAFSSPSVAAIICFEYGNPHYNSASVMIRSLAYQLACRLSDYRAQLLEKLKTPGIFDLDDTELFDQLLVQPLSVRAIDGQHEVLCVVLDGLDECTEGEINTAAEVLGRCADGFPPWLRVLVTSRRDSAVACRIGPDRVLALNGGDPNNLEDIAGYLRRALAQDTPLPAEEIDRTARALCARSDGTFLYAYMAAEAIRAGMMDPTDENAFPDRLSKVFRLWIRRVFPDSAEYRETFRAPLCALIASPEPLPEEEFTRLMNMAETQVWDFKRRMKVFFAEGTDAFGQKTVSFSHRYLRDWLGSEEAGSFAASAADGMKALADGCFRQFTRNPETLSGYETLWLPFFLERADMPAALEAVNASGAYFGRLIKWTDRCVLFGKTAAASALCRNMLANASARGAKWDLVKAYGRIAAIRTDLGELGQALETHEKSLALLETLDREESSAETRRGMAVCREKIANILLARGEPDSACALYRECFAAYREIAGAQDTPETRGALARIRIRIADIRLLKGETEQALALYLEALSIREAIASELGTCEARNGLSVICERTGDTLRRLGRWEEALAYYHRGAEINEALMRDEDTPKVRRGLLLCQSSIADIHMAEGRLDEALEMYEKCLQLNREMAIRTDTPQTRMDLSVSYERISDVYIRQGRLAEAQALYLESLAIREELAEKLGTVNALWNLCATHYSLGRCLEVSGDRARALPHYSKARDLCAAVAGKIPQYSQRRDLMALAVERCKALCESANQ